MGVVDGVLAHHHAPHHAVEAIVGRTTPASSAPAMVKVFMVDPGSKVSVMARLRVAPSAALPGSLG